MRQHMMLCWGMGAHTWFLATTERFMYTEEAIHTQRELKRKEGSVFQYRLTAHKAVFFGTT